MQALPPINTKEPRDHGICTTSPFLLHVGLQAQHLTLTQLPPEACESDLEPMRPLLLRH
jgi:hypothetical protein